MITPEKTEYILDSLKVHKELQESILRDIARRLVDNPGIITDTAAWQTEKLQQAGFLFEDITKELEKATKRQKDEIKEAFKTAETTIFDYDDKIIAEAGFAPAEFKKLSPAMQKAWQATLSKTSTEAINLTKTTALTSQSAYIEACDLAMMQVQSGAFTLDTALKNACLTAGSKGVNVIYPSGWVDKLDVAIRRSTFTGMSQTAGKLQEMRADEMDQDIMELSAHAGARPEHAEWQGQLVSRSGKPGYLSLEDIGYGTVTGFKGVNCSHEWFIFFEGISKRAYTEEQLEAFKNETVTYNGKDVPLWKAKDYQRAVERTIKETKRQLVVLDEAIKNAKTDSLRDELKAEFSSRSVLLKKQEARLKDFCNQTGIYYDKSRLQVFTQTTENGIKNWGKSVSGKAVWAKRKNVQSAAANAAVRNTHRVLQFDADAVFDVKLDSLNDIVNNGLSIASRKVAEIGGQKRIECLSLVDINTGKELFFEEGDESSVGYRRFWDFLEKNKDKDFAFIHNHNSDGYFSENDMMTLLYNETIKLSGAIRIDGVMYFAQKTVTLDGNVHFDNLFKDELKDLNLKSRNGIISGAERTKMREEIIVDNLLKRFTKGLIEIDGRR